MSQGTQSEWRKRINEKPPDEKRHKEEEKHPKKINREHIGLTRHCNNSGGKNNISVATTSTSKYSGCEYMAGKSDARR